MSFEDFTGDPSTRLADAHCRIAALEAEVTKWSCAWCEANARLADFEASCGSTIGIVKQYRARIAELEAEKQEFANFQLHEVVELRERIAELEAKDRNGNEIIEKYRKLHVEQHQQIHKLQTELDYWRPAEQSASRLAIKSSLDLEAARQRIADLETP